MSILMIGWLVVFAAVVDAAVRIAQRLPHGGDVMNYSTHIVVAYATRHGSTKVADAIAQTLAMSG